MQSPVMPANRMLRLAIVDDEGAQLQLLSVIAQEWADEAGVKILIRTCSSADNFWFEWQGDKNWDAVLLDIQMDGMDGMTLARRIRETDDNLSIIFTTGLSDYIADGYDVSALHYLLKPIKRDALFTCLDKALQKKRIEHRCLLLDDNGDAVRVPLHHILYAEACMHSVIIKATTGEYTFKRSFSKVESELDESFIRCHRSYIAALRHIARITRSEVIFDNGQTIPLSRRLYQQVNQAFINYYRGQR